MLDYDNIMARVEKGLIRPLDGLRAILQEEHERIEMVSEAAYEGSFGKAIFDGNARDIWNMYDVIEDDTMNALKKLISLKKSV